MTVTLNIPDILAVPLSKVEPTLPHVILESFAVQGYRQGILSAAQVRTLLEHDSRWETEEFLAAHDAWPDTSMAEVASGAASLKEMRQS